jgi:hypothetical protein
MPIVLIARDQPNLTVLPVLQLQLHFKVNVFHVLILILLLDMTPYLRNVLINVDLATDFQKLQFRICYL